MNDSSPLPIGSYYEQCILIPPRTIQEPVPVVTDAVIARCRRCRTYINPFVTFIEGGARWKCCMCNLSNEVPQLFDWDSQTNQPADRWSRPELNHGVVEFIAPGEYLVSDKQQKCWSGQISIAYVVWCFSLTTLTGPTTSTSNLRLCYRCVSTSHSIR